MKPLVSVLLPVYQTEQYIGHAIESVLNQSLKDWELVVSDNASTDRTVEVIERYRDARIRLIRQPHNLGMVANWAFLVGEGCGDLGCVLGADDLWEPAHLERKVNLLSKHPEALFVHGPVRLIDSKSNFLGLFETGQGRETRSRDFLELNFQENRVNPSAAVFRLARCKELGLGFDLRYSLVMDWHFWMLLALHSDIVLGDSEATARYRQHPESGVAKFGHGFTWHYERYLLRSDLLLEYGARWREFGLDPERKNRDLLQVIWPYALQRLRHGRMEEFNKLWMLYRRAYSPLDALMQLPRYLFGPVGGNEELRSGGEGWRMSRRASLNTAGASYAQFATIVLTGLISAPLALKYLGEERLGLWSFTIQSLGYFLLLDLGVTASAGRLMGEPIHRDDPKECSRWFTLFIAVLSLESLLVVGSGYLLLDHVLDWFSIAPELRPEARALWLMMLLVNALAFPLRVSAGILFAQNRYYWSMLSGALGQWFGLLAFFLFLRKGAGSLAYGYSSIAAMVLSYGLPWLAVRVGPQRFRADFGSMRWKDLGALFNYSSSVFLIGLATQVVFLSQTLVVTKILGLSAVALFTYSSRTGQYGLQLLWRGFDAMSPRWQQLYVAGNKTHLAASFQRYTGLTMSLALAGSTLLIVLNRPFVEAWMKPGLYAGPGFDLLLTLYVVQHAWNHCLGFCVVVAKVIRPLSILAVVEMALNIGLSVALAPKLGVSGILAGSILGSMVTTIYLTWKAPPCVFLSLRELARPSILSWVALAACATMAFVWVRLTPMGEEHLWIRGFFCALAAIIFAVLNRDHLGDFLSRAKGAI